MKCPRMHMLDAAVRQAALVCVHAMRGFWRRSQGERTSVSVPAMRLGGGSRPVARVEALELSGALPTREAAPSRWLLSPSGPSGLRFAAGCVEMLDMLCGRLGAVLSVMLALELA